MRNAVFVSCRSASTRLPRKAYLELYPKVSLIEHIIRRAKLVTEANVVVLCTTELQEDDLLAEIAATNGVEIFRGSVEDKLLRWLGAATKFEVGKIVTMDGDDPFCDPHLSGSAFAQLEDLDFIESSEIVTGGFTYALRTEALKQVCAIKDSNQTEMMWTYFKDTGLFRTGTLAGIPKNLMRSDMRLTLDYEEDLRLFRMLFEMLGEKEEISLSKVVGVLTQRTDLKEINFFRQSEFVANQLANTHLAIKGDESV
jgi:spore coat polysaccharide biosynthesis protein SpsF (cytidylyltransferase family)